MTDDKLIADIRDHCSEIDRVLTRISANIKQLSQKFEEMEHKEIILGELMTILKSLEHCESEIWYIGNDQQKVLEWRYEDIEQYEKRLRDMRDIEKSLKIERIIHLPGED